MKKFKPSDIEKNWEKDLEKRKVLTPKPIKPKWEERFRDLYFSRKTGKYTSCAIMVNFVFSLLVNQRREFLKMLTEEFEDMGMRETMGDFILNRLKEKLKKL